MEFDITLAKEKYRTQKQPYRCGLYRSRQGNCHGSTPKYSKSDQGTGPRMRAYWGNVSR